MSELTVQQYLRGVLIEGFVLRLEAEAVRTYGVDVAPLAVRSYRFAPRPPEAMRQTDDGGAT